VHGVSAGSMPRPDPVLEAFPVLGSLPGAVRRDVLARAVRRRLDDRQGLVNAGAACSHLPLVLDGSLRVFTTSGSGREITLYRIGRGESCVLSATCIVRGDRFPAVAAAEGTADVLLVPADVAARMVDEQPAWRRFIFDLYARRLGEVLTLIEEVAFQRVDERLAAHLLARAPGGGPVLATHAAIADELGTSREVVTRILADFEARGLVSLHRGHIDVSRPAELGSMAGSSAR
jgi:CRP/FNR family transcriptional regulator, anaerobic regulatory protein